MSDPSLLYVPGYPGQGLGGVSRGFTQSRGGGVSPLNLPYLYNFDNETVGQPVDGWESMPTNTTGTFVVPVVANSTGDRVSYNPNRKGLYFDTTATNYVAMAFPLPGIVDVSGGFRMAWWWKGEVSAQVAIMAALYGGNPYTGGEGSGVRFEHRNDVGQQCQGGCHAGGAWQGSANIGNTSAKGNEWVKWHLEYNPATGAISGAVRRYSNDWHLLTIAGTMPGAATLAAAWETADRVWFYNNNQANVYCRDMWLLGFWLGRTTDAYPPAQMPVSL